MSYRQSPFYWAGFIESLFKSAFKMDKDSKLNDEQIERLVRILIEVKETISQEEIDRFKEFYK